MRIARQHQDDKDATLQKLAEAYGKPIVDILLIIQERQVWRGKDLGIIRNLEVFFPSCNHRLKRGYYSDSILERHYGVTLLRKEGGINAYEDSNYVAVSWAWQLYADDKSRVNSRAYEVQTRDGADRWPSPVRNRVLDRALSYMSHEKVPWLWIDRHSIPQKTKCKAWRYCNHNTCVKKRESLQAMDLVYKYSDHPLGLIEMEIKSRRDLTQLTLIMDQKLVEKTEFGGNSRLFDGAELAAAKEALRLVHRITGDIWWRRAWIYQENYRAGTGMTLLIGHSHSLEKAKRSHGIFGNLHGELCLNSVDFSYQVTKLCLAIQSSEDITKEDRVIIQDILSAAGKYTILLPRSQSMSASIIADIERRDVGDPWDRLAITANCCQYPIRFDNEELKKREHSPSLATLAMYLLNGEILDNSDRPSHPEHGLASSMTVSQFLMAGCFDGFYAPSDKYSLSFNKGCRFTEVHFTPDGILTKGYIWELGEIIQTTNPSKHVRRTDDRRGSFEARERKRLAQLIAELKDLSHNHLAAVLQRQLNYNVHREKNAERRKESFSHRAMRTMAKEVVRAIEQGKSLRLGTLVGRQDASAIFVWDQKPTAEPLPSYVFTASWPRDATMRDYDNNDLDRHISLQVHFSKEGRNGDGFPRLRTLRWITGLCFFVDCPREEVLFPWPSALKNIGPGASLKKTKRQR